MSGAYKYGTICPICHAKHPTRRYMSHESKFAYCAKHTRQEIVDYETRPAKMEQP